jgi:di/tricarboxylate transporter
MLGLTPLQATAIAIIAVMMALFIWGRWRYDLVAALTLLVATLLGVVPADKAFTGFANPVVIIIASVLVVGQSISTSGILDGLVRRLLRNVGSPSVQIAALASCVAVLSAFVKNIGTLGIFMPVAIQTARRSKQSPSIYLMPLAFASLIGGTMTLIGTSPNLLISSVRQDVEGRPFGLFDFLWVGAPLTVIAVLFLAVGWRLLPGERTGPPGADETFEIGRYTTELGIGEKSRLIGKRVGDLEQLGDGEVMVRAITRENGHHYLPDRYWRLYPGDIVTVQADSAAIKRLTDEGRLELVGAKQLEGAAETDDELGVVEAIVTVRSPLLGQTPQSINLRSRFDVNLLAVSRAGHNRHVHLQNHRFEVGDVVALQGWRTALPARLTELGCLPLADRGLGLGQTRRGLVPLAILAFAMVLVALQIVPVAIGFFGSAVLVVLARQLTLKEAYESIEGSLIVMLGALIPVSEALKDTGATDVLASLLAAAGSNVSGLAALAMMLGVSMLLTPFLHHAAAVLVLGPIAAVLARSLGYSTDPFLMAVALGCACDFLTPIGHQNNLLVMRPGGYRFTDYWRLGLPLSLLVLLLGTPLIATVWPLG